MFRKFENPWLFASRHRSALPGRKLPDVPQIREKEFGCCGKNRYCVCSTFSIEGFREDGERRLSHRQRTRASPIPKGTTSPAPLRDGPDLLLVIKRS